MSLRFPGSVIPDAAGLQRFARELGLRDRAQHEGYGAGAWAPLKPAGASSSLRIARQFLNSRNHTHREREGERYAFRVDTEP